jgi:hypothetical protein
MSEGSETPDRVELIRGYTELMDRDCDLDALDDLGLWAPDIVWDLSDQGLGIYESAAAIRGFLEGWWANWDDHHHEIQEILDLCHGLMFVALWEDGRPVGSSGRVQARAGYRQFGRFGKWGKTQLRRQGRPCIRRRSWGCISKRRRIQQGVPDRLIDKRGESNRADGCWAWAGGGYKNKSGSVSGFCEGGSFASIFGGKELNAPNPYEAIP